MNYDCYAFRVAPGARGWAAHRDRAGDASSPGYATCWVALTDCGPDTACAVSYTHLTLPTILLV